MTAAQKPTDLDSAIVFGDSVIKSGAHTLEANYANLYSASYANHTPPKPGFDGATPLGDASKLAANNNSTEIIFAAQYSNSLAHCRQWKPGSLVFRYTVRCGYPHSGYDT